VGLAISRPTSVAEYRVAQRAVRGDDSRWAVVADVRVWSGSCSLAIRQRSERSIDKMADLLATSAVSRAHKISFALRPRLPDRPDRCEVGAHPDGGENTGPGPSHTL